MDYVIRICTKVWVKTDGFTGKLKDYPVKKGDCRLLRDVQHRSPRLCRVAKGMATRTTP